MEHILVQGKAFYSDDNSKGRGRQMLIVFTLYLQLLRLGGSPYCNTDHLTIFSGNYEIFREAYIDSS